GVRGHRVLAAPWVLQLGDHAARLHVRVGQHLVGVEHGATRDARAGQDLERLVLRVLLGPRLDHRVDLVDELYAVAAVGVARLVGQLGPAEDGDERLPHLGGRAVDEHVIVRAAGAAAIDVGRRGRRRAVALTRRRLAGGVALAQVDAKQVHHRFLLGDLDLLAHARRVALDDRGEDADGRVQAGAGVGEAADGLRRRAVGRAG